MAGAKNEKWNRALKLNAYDWLPLSLRIITPDDVPGEAYITRRNPHKRAQLNLPNRRHIDEHIASSSFRVSLGCLITITPFMILQQES